MNDISGINLLFITYHWHCTLIFIVPQQQHVCSHCLFTILFIKYVLYWLISQVFVGLFVLSCGNVSILIYKRGFYSVKTSMNVLKFYICILNRLFHMKHSYKDTQCNKPCNGSLLYLLWPYNQKENQIANEGRVSTWLEWNKRR